MLEILIIQFECSITKKFYTSLQKKRYLEEMVNNFKKRFDVLGLFFNAWR